MRLYLDANTIVYAIEGSSPFYEAVVSRIMQTQASSGGSLITSRLSRLECRVKPMRDRAAALLTAYDTFFAHQTLALLEIDAGVIERATDLRVRYNLQTPDAIHLATALQGQADVFLTGDKALARCSEVAVEVV